MLQLKFYRLLEKIGYSLVLKPVKIFSLDNGGKIRKANCDVDLTFYAMKEKELFDRGIFLTGDGDFYILLKYLIKIKRTVIVIANAKRTAKEIKTLPGIQFNDFGGLKGTINFSKKIRRGLRTSPPHVL